MKIKLLLVIPLIILSLKGMQESDISLYSYLNVQNNATREEIKKAYKDCSLIYHPDKYEQSSIRNRMSKQEAEEHFKKIKEVYEILSNNKTRKMYDDFGLKYVRSYIAQEEKNRRAAEEPMAQQQSTQTAFTAKRSSQTPKQDEAKSKSEEDIKNVLEDLEAGTKIINNLITEFYTYSFRLSELEGYYNEKIQECISLLKMPKYSIIRDDIKKTIIDVSQLFIGVLLLKMKEDQNLARNVLLHAEEIMQSLYLGVNDYRFFADAVTRAREKLAPRSQPYTQQHTAFQTKRPSPQGPKQADPKRVKTTEPTVDSKFKQRIEFIIEEHKRFSDYLAQASFLKENVLTYQEFSNMVQKKIDFIKPYITGIPENLILGYKLRNSMLRHIFQAILLLKERYTEFKEVDWIMACGWGKNLCSSAFFIYSISDDEDKAVVKELSLLNSYFDKEILHSKIRNIDYHLRSKSSNIIEDARFVLHDYENKIISADPIMQDKAAKHFYKFAKKLLKQSERALAVELLNRALYLRWSNIDGIYQTIEKIKNLLTKLNYYSIIVTNFCQSNRKKLEENSPDAALAVQQNIINNNDRLKNSLSCCVIHRFQNFIYSTFTTTNPDLLNLYYDCIQLLINSHFLNEALELINIVICQYDLDKETQDRFKEQFDLINQMQELDKQLESQPPMDFNDIKDFLSKE